jgi:hypothetical protein
MDCSAEQQYPLIVNRYGTTIKRTFAHCRLLAKVQHSDIQRRRVAGL